MVRVFLCTALALGVVVWLTDVRAEDSTPVQLRDELAQQAGGKSVLLVAGQAGLVARTADGTWSRTLVSDAVDHAEYDAAKDIVWLKRGNKLDVVDLRAEKPALVPILTGVGFGGFEIAGDTMFRGDERSVDYVILNWAKQPTLDARQPVCTGCSSEAEEREVERSLQRQMKMIKIVGKKWLKQHYDRKPRAVASAESKPATQVGLPTGWDDCRYYTVYSYADSWEEEVEKVLCGQARSFGETGLQLVVAQSNTSCVLYDPARKLFAGPGAPAKWSATDATAAECANVVLDLSGTSYAIADPSYSPSSTVCTMTGCESLAGDAVFWLDVDPYAEPAILAAPAASVEVAAKVAAVSADDWAVNTGVAECDRPLTLYGKCLVAKLPEGAAREAALGGLQQAVDALVSGASTEEGRQILPAACEQMEAAFGDAAQALGCDWPAAP